MSPEDLACTIHEFSRDSRISVGSSLILLEIPGSFLGSSIQKNSRRLELAISKNVPHGRCGQGPGSVDPRFLAGLPFPVPEILKFKALRDPGNISGNISREFSLGFSSGTPESRSQKQPQPSRVF